MMLLIACMPLSFAHASLTWESGDLTSGGVTGNGWWVQMYDDADNDTELSAVTFMENTGVASGVGNSGTDVLLSSFSCTIEEFLGSYAFGVLYNDSGDNSYSSIVGSHVYSVVFNADTIANSSQSVVLDSTSYVVPSATTPESTSTYHISGVANSWQNLVAVPEPTTLAFLGIGCLAFMARRKMRRT